MPSIRMTESIAKIVKGSSTTVTLPASRINIGGQQFLTSSNITLSTSTIGAGGVDATAVLNSLYYVYAVISNSAVALISSLNSSLPSGFTTARLVGHFVYDITSNITVFYNGQYDGTVASLNSSPAKNHIINGNFDYWQRSGPIVTNANYVYAMDRFYIYGSATTLSRQTAGAPLGSQNYTRVIYNSAGSYANMSNALDSQTVNQIVGKTVTLSLKIRRNATYTGTYTIGIHKNASANTQTGGTWVTLSNSVISNSSIPISTGSSSDWATFSVTVTIPNDGTALGLRCYFGEGATQPAGAQIEISQAILNEGSIASPFAYAGGNSTSELSLCQRYYEKSYGVDVVPGTAVGPTEGGFFYNVDTASSIGLAPFRVMKRIVPSIVTFQPATGTSGVARNAIGGTNVTVTVADISQTGFHRLSGTLTTGQSLNVSWTSDAELT